MVMEKVTVIARMTMVTIIPTEILRFIALLLPSDQQHHRYAPEQGEHEHTRQDQTADLQNVLAFFVVHTPDGLLTKTTERLISSEYNLLD